MSVAMIPEAVVLTAGAATKPGFQIIFGGFLSRRPRRAEEGSSGNRLFLPPAFSKSILRICRSSWMNTEGEIRNYLCCLRSGGTNKVVLLKNLSSAHVSCRQKSKV